MNQPSILLMLFGMLYSLGYYLEQTPKLEPITNLLNENIALLEKDKSIPFLNEKSFLEDAKYILNKFFTGLSFSNPYKKIYKQDKPFFVLCTVWIQNLETVWILVLLGKWVRMVKLNQEFPLQKFQRMVFIS